MAKSKKRSKKKSKKKLQEGPASMQEQLNARLDDRSQGTSMASLDAFSEGVGDKTERDDDRDALLAEDVRARLDGQDLGKINRRYRKDSELVEHLPFLQAVIELKTAPPVELPMAEAYKGLPKSKYQKDFIEQSEDMKSSVPVVKNMNRVHEQALLDREASGEPMSPEEAERSSFIKEREKNLKAAAGELFVMLDVKNQGKLSAMVRDTVAGSSEPKLAALGAVAWEVISLEAAGAEGEKPVTVPKAALGKALFEYGRDIDGRASAKQGSVWSVLGPMNAKRAAIEAELYNKDRDEDALDSLRDELDVLEDAYQTDHASYVPIKDEMEKFRLFAMPWAEATAALGQDPMGQAITDSFSVVGADYRGDAGDGKKGSDVIGARMDEVESEDGANAWTDMDMGFAMWSMAGNLDRYRDTKVYLYGTEEGSDVTRGGEGASSRVTQLELQVASEQENFGGLSDRDGQSAYNLNRFNGIEGGDPEKLVRVLPDGTRLYENGRATGPDGEEIRDGHQSTGEKGGKKPGKKGGKKSGKKGGKKPGKKAKKPDKGGKSGKKGPKKGKR